MTDKCNFRCPYCMPVEVFGDDYQFAPKSTVLTFEEIEKLASLAASLGAEKLRITGGEPLLRKDLLKLIEKLAAIEGIRNIALTTNGWFLKKFAAPLRDAGLNRVTVSLDSLDPETFARMNGRGYKVTQVLEGIDSAVAAGLTPIKVNAVIKRGENEASIVDLARHFKGSGIIVRYIEYMDVGNKNGWCLDHVVPAADIVAGVNEVFPLKIADPNFRGEVAKRYRYADDSGEIGVISSISQPFCGDCSRARLSTDGKLFTCLFGDNGANLRDPLRAGASDEALLKLITDTWHQRTDKYSELRRPLPANEERRKVEMYQIGG